MTEQSMHAIETAIQNLQARQPRPRGRREALAQYAPQLRDLLAAGWARSEIIGEIKALGGQMSPALLRDVLQLPPPKTAKTSQAKAAKPQSPTVPSPASPLPPAAMLYDPGQQGALVAPSFSGRAAEDADAE